MKNIKNYNKASFADNLIFRHENNGVLIFNKYNSAVLKITKSLFNLINQNTVPCEQKYTNAINILRQNNMLDDKCLNPRVKTSSKNKLNIPDGNLFSIKSKIAPITGLWAITPKCNLKCVYCFPEINNLRHDHVELALEQLQTIAKQIVESRLFQLTISGGEAFLCPHLWRIIPILHAADIKLTIITNGTSINTDIVKKLQRYQLITGVSLDAPNERINSITRGKGVFNKTLEGIRLLIKNKIPTVALVTITKFNFPTLEQHVEFLSDLGIKDITLQDLRPFGNKKNYTNYKLTNSQEMILYYTIKKILQNHRDISFNLSELFIFPRKERKIPANGKIMQCPAGDNFAYIDYDGNMYPCTNLPQIKLGNLLKDGNIMDLWQNSTGIKKLRSLKTEKIIKIHECSNCSMVEYCDGGCRGDALFYSNDLYGCASRCPKFMNKGENNYV